MKNKEIIVLSIALAFVGSVFLTSLIQSSFRKTEYTIEVYEIFEVVHVSNPKQTLTCVYTKGQGQFFFRGDLPINESKSYSFTYVENGKRWRDLTLLSYREFVPLVRDDTECQTCPQ